MKKVDQKLDEILEQCLADIKSGRATREDCLLRYKEQASELAPLLRAATSLYKLPAPRISERRVMAGRQRILQELSATERTPWWIGLRRALTVPTLAFSAALAFVLMTVLGAGTALMAYRDSLLTQTPGYPNPEVVPSLVPPVANTAQPAISFNGIGVSNDSGGPYEIASAPDGRLWFAQTDATRVGSVDTNGQILDWPIASKEGRAAGVTVDPAGKVWFTVSSSQSIYALDPELNQISSWNVTPGDGTLGRIAAGKDGYIWFIAAEGNRIYSLEPKTNKFTSYEVEGAQYLEWADDTLWFSGKPGQLGRITSDGQVQLFNVPGDPAAMVWDGTSLWYAGGSLIGQFNTASGIVIQTYALEIQADRIATDGLGNIWFGSQGGSKLGVLQASGQINTRSLALVQSLYWLAVGTDKIWMSDAADNSFIYALSLSESLSEHPDQFLMALLLPPLADAR